ncbi:PKD domain-containing protein [Streptosporangium canum]|uniref:PKD domain-containing protein n=1 Tax=Streptosporangium canum TaxID=324952 RepID=UPI00343861D6
MLSLAAALNGNGQAFGDAGVAKYVMWDRGVAVALPSEYLPGLSYHNEWMQGRLPRINGRGAVTGGYALGRDADGTPRDSGPAVYADGVITKLAGTVEGCAETAGRASDLNNTGLVVGTLRCGRYEGKTTKHAYVWKDGEPTDLGEGEATAVNDNEMIVGLEPRPYPNAQPPVMWVDGTKYPLAGVLSRPWCPQDSQKTTEPCMGIRKLQDVNSSGQILAQGFVRDRSPDSDGFTLQDRSFLLSPTTARADLEVTTTVSPAEPGPGSKVTWTATVTNKGDDTATDVRLDVLIPQAVTGATCGTICTAIKGGYRNTVKVLEPGGSATVKVTATIPADAADGTELKTQAHGYSLAVADPKPDNNAASASATVRPLLDKPGVNWTDPVRVGSVSYPAAVTLTNRLNDPIPLKAIAVSGPFAQSNTCPVELAVGAKCVVQLTFAPTQEGPASGALTFTTADGAAPAYTAPLSGTGATANAKPVVQAPAAPLRGVVGKPFTLQADFTDADTGDTHTAQVLWGDGPPVPAQVEQRAGGGTVTVSRTFTAPRTGTAVVVVTDSNGNMGGQKIPYVIEEAAPNTAPVTVPVTNAAPEVTLKVPAVAKVVPVGEAVSLSASFTDSGKGDTHTATWSIGGQPVAAAVAENGGKGTATGSHVFTKAGLYPISVTVTDNHTGATMADTVDGKTAYVLVYDPAGSLVGAGQTVSPAGACTLDAECAKEGKATVNVTARYRDKATTPTGELRYNAPGFDLRDGSYRVLAVAGGTAILRGTAKVNKTIEATYEITTVDSGKPADRTDRLVVRVWKKNGELIYDNSGKPATVSGVIRVSG